MDDNENGYNDIGNSDDDDNNNNDEDDDDSGCTSIGNDRDRSRSVLEVNFNPRYHLPINLRIII